MKIISNGELYVKRSDIEFLSHYDSTFPLDLALEHLMDIQENKYIRITNQNQIDYLLSQSDVLDFNLFQCRRPEDIKLMILKIKMKLYEESESSTEKMTPEEFRASQIEAYKNKMRIEYLISQLKEILAYKKGLNSDIYPDIPNPLYTGVTNGEITSGISIKHGNIVFYKENGEEITREDIDNEFYNHAVNIVKRDIRKQNENDETELVEVQSDNKKYLVLESKTLRCNSPKTLKLIDKRESNQ